MRGVSMAQEGALLILRDSASSQEWTIGDELAIGRDLTCDVCLSDRQVSRRHASIRRTAGSYVLVDNGSKNGTWVNGCPVTGPTALADGDEVSIAARFKLYFVDAEATAPLVFEGRGLRIDPETLTVYVNGEPLEPPLSGLQWDLLLMLYRAGGALITRDEIIDAVWTEADPEGVSEDSLDALVRRLRLRIEEIDPHHQYIVTVRGHGFRLDNV